jgi:ParB family chromosome partitioning protein
MKETKAMCSSWSDDHGVKLENVKISDLHDFKEHPFHVVEDSALFELTKSIEDKGVLVPLIVRANPYTQILSRCMRLG